VKKLGGFNHPVPFILYKISPEYGLRVLLEILYTYSRFEVTYSVAFSEVFHQCFPSSHNLIFDRIRYHVSRGSLPAAFCLDLHRTTASSTVRTASLALGVHR
jgi:hypothetical protein